MEINIQSCTFGHVLIGTSWKDKLVAIELGSSLEELMKNFITCWNKPSASRYLSINRDQPDNRVVEAVLKIINEGGQLDRNVLQNMCLSGTAFQCQVWHSLLQIPSGAVETYQQVAHRIGAPKAVRAVANAIGANPIAIAVPCHRVVRSDGKIGGYRWGETIKNRLLDRERI